MALSEDRLKSFEEHFKKGQKESSAHNYEEAKNHYISALESHPQAVEALVAKAHVEIKLENFQQGKKDADLAIATALEPSVAGSRASVVCSASDDITDLYVRRVIVLVQSVLRCWRR